MHSAKYNRLSFSVDEFDTRRTRLIMCVIHLCVCNATTNTDESEELNVKLNCKASVLLQHKSNSSSPLSSSTVDLSCFIIIFFHHWFACPWLTGVFYLTQAFGISDICTVRALQTLGRKICSELKAQKNAKDAISINLPSELVSNALLIASTGLSLFLSLKSPPVKLIKHEISFSASKETIIPGCAEKKSCMDKLWADRNVTEDPILATMQPQFADRNTWKSGCAGEAETEISSARGNYACILKEKKEKTDATKLSLSGKVHSFITTTLPAGNPTWRGDGGACKASRMNRDEYPSNSSPLDKCIYKEDVEGVDSQDKKIYMSVTS